ncbi:MAG: hypothetical protein AB7N80_05875 [Bdellovibrionales bacterium]
MKNNRGMITVDFLFAFVLVMGFGAILFALSLTLTVAEVTQYVTYASARNYMAANLTPDLQQQKAVLKYQELLGHPTFVKLYTNGWFEVEETPNVGDISQMIQAYQQPGTTPNKFWGVGTAFVARMLEFEIPFYGSTDASGDGSGSTFGTFLGSYLGREITTAECLNYTAQRWNAIRNLAVSGGAAAYSTAPSGGYRIYDDNGC